MRLAAAAGGELAPEADAAVRRLADAWLDSALAAACGAARRRKSAEVTPDDAVTYLERTWCALSGHQAHVTEVFKTPPNGDVSGVRDVRLPEGCKAMALLSHM